MVLDGWGLAGPGPGNAVSLAKTPVFDGFWRHCPHTTLRACGSAVGLPEGQMGNSEVGHLNIGAGSVVKQDLVRIDEAVSSRSLAGNEGLRSAFADAKRVHLIGLVSDGGVHSSLEHVKALIALGRELAPEAEMVIHAFTDGRDTLPHSGEGFLAELDAIPQARVGSVVGRYFAMDRDRRWERTQRAYDLLVHGAAPHRASSGTEAVRAAYGRGETDEFIEPTVVVGSAATGSRAGVGEAGASGRGEGAGGAATIGPDDSVICFNFRPDRMRQLVRALADPRLGRGEELPGWAGRGGAPPVGRLTTLTEYEEGWRYPVAFGPDRPAVTLAEVLAGTGAGQLHVAETEKYPHVTYFFNGGREAPLPGELRELVQSPRDVPTYDHKPEMSAAEAAAAFVDQWREHSPRFGVINFANADMVGHTGVIPAAVKAVETVDRCLGDVTGAVHQGGGVCVITADHGNSDHMLEPDGSPNTAHSLNPVPLIVTAEDVTVDDREGILADIAPTVLDLLGIEKPSEMTGQTLLAHS